MQGTFVGLDIDGAGIHAAVRPTGERWDTPGHDQGILEATQRLHNLQPTLVVMEAQGGYELPIAGTFATLGLPFVLVMSNNVREFARAIGRKLADESQAGILAYFAELVRPEVRPLPEEMLARLRALKTRRQQMLEMLELERTRLNQPSVVLQKDVKNHVTHLERGLINLSEEVGRTVRSNCVWR